MAGTEIAKLDDLYADAIQLKQKVEDSGIQVATEDLVQRLDLVSHELSLDSLIPGSSPAMGMAARNRDGKSFYEAFIDNVRERLCAEEGEFNKLILRGIDTSVGAVLTALVTALNVPLVALTLLVPIAVILCHSGLAAYCEVSAPA